MNRVKHYLKEIVIFIIVMTIFANLISLYKSSKLNNSALHLKSITLLNEKKYLFDSDKPVLIHFWATWCPTCKLEASNIEFISKRFNVVTIAVNSGSDADISKYLAENNLSINVVNDKHSIYSHEFKIVAFPTTFIYDKSGELIFSEVGYTSTLGLWLRMWWIAFYKSF